MGDALEGTVFDFHTDHARKLRSFPQPSGYAVGKGKKAAAGLGSVGYVFGQCDGITDASAGVEVTTVLSMPLAYSQRSRPWLFKWE